MKKDILTLGIESSCDETSVSVVKNGREILSNVIDTQIPIHEKYGGVVPEIASRNHIEAISRVTKLALKEANEETSLKNLKVLSDGFFGIQILTVDSHVKRGKFVPSHLHLDCCFLLEADENEVLKIKEDENSGVEWVDIDKADIITNEEKMKPIYRKLNEKLKL